jgi:hypothetical protein
MDQWTSTLWLMKKSVLFSMFVFTSSEVQMTSAISIRQWLLGIKDRQYVVSPTSYPARITSAMGRIRFTFADHTIAEIEVRKVQSWSTKQTIEEFDTLLSSKFGLNKLAWEYTDVDTFLKEFTDHC